MRPSGRVPLVCAPYVDPRVVDLYEDGTTIGDVVRDEFPTTEERQAAIELAVLQMLAKS